MKTLDETRFVDTTGRIKVWPSKQQDQLLVLAYLATKLDYSKSYNEPEINELLKRWHTFNDWPLLRRELFVRGFVDRHKDGSNYQLKRLPTILSDLILVQPNIAKDASVAVTWLEGEAGRETLRLMGNPDAQYSPPTLDKEQERLREFVTSSTQDTWMLRYKNQTVGAIWLSFVASDYLQSPSLSIMIGDRAARGLGIGTAAVETVITHFKQARPTGSLYARHLTDNSASAKLLHSVGFTNDGQVYSDKDNLSFQNLSLKFPLASE